MLRSKVVPICNNLILLRKTLIKVQANFQLLSRLIMVKMRKALFKLILLLQISLSLLMILLVFWANISQFLQMLNILLMKYTKSKRLMKSWTFSTREVMDCFLWWIQPIPKSIQSSVKFPNNPIYLIGDANEVAKDVYHMLVEERKRYEE